MLKNLIKASSDYYLRNYSHKPEKLNPDWKVEENILNQILIRWPERYEWDSARDWVNILLQGFKDKVTVEMVSDIPQPYKGTVVHQVAMYGKLFDVAIGYSDYMPIDEECANQCQLYFKMQYKRGGYDHPHVIPGGYVAEGSGIYFQLNKLRKIREQKRYASDVYGRYGVNAAKETREKAVNILKNQNLFQFSGGMEPVSYNKFLDEIVRSKICIDLPGQGDFCFRLINYLAVGAFVIAHPHGTDLHVPLTNGQQLVYCKSDYSDLVELCKYYIDHDEERERIAENGREFFDLYLHKDNLTQYYLWQVSNYLIN